MAAPAVLEPHFRLRERGTGVLREVRGGVATFFALAYIVVLNPLILGSGKDMYGHPLSTAQLTVAAAVVAGLGLGLNGVLAYTIAPMMSWPDAMGLVVLEGIGICLLVVTGLRRMIMDAIPIPIPLKRAIGVGLFIALIGLVDAGFVTRVPDAAHTTVPVQLGSDGSLNGWSVLIFCLGVLGTFLLLVRKVPGAILLSIVGCTVVAVIVNSAAHLTAADWGLIQPKLPHHLFASPDFGPLGHFSLFGGFVHAGVVTAVVFIFTLMLYRRARVDRPTSSTPWARSSA
jgi:adenine/guanine/hypoxanthine permease